jgi:hypothetical protein
LELNVVQAWLECHFIAAIGFILQEPAEVTSG